MNPIWKIQMAEFHKPKEMEKLQKKTKKWRKLDEFQIEKCDFYIVLNKNS